MLKNLFVLYILFLPFGISAQPKITLSEESIVSLITCEPGQELYEAFGHTAIRVFDPESGFDLVYNYGTFSFSQPNFYGKFIQGNLLYMLGVNKYDNFVLSYEYYNRSVREQYLHLSLEQKQSIIDKLSWNSLKENREYHYNYFFDNCSTRPRDVIQDALGGVIVFDSTFLGKERLTIRELTDLYILDQQPWGDLGIDLCLGQRIDQKATAEEYMYLPEELEKAFDHAYIIENGERVPLVDEKKVVFQSAEIADAESWFVPRIFFVVLLLLGAVLLTVQRLRKKSTRFFDGMLFISTSLVGWLGLFLWFLTDHYIADYNWNILWALPTNVIFGIALFWKKRPNWVRMYALALVLLYAVMLVGWNYIPQLLHYSMRFLVFLLLFSAWGVFRTQPKAAQ